MSARNGLILLRCCHATAAAPFASKYGLARGRTRVGLIGIRRRLERVDVASQRVQGLIGRPLRYPALGIGQEAIRTEIRGVTVRNQGGVAHQIGDTAMLMRGGVAATYQLTRLAWTSMG